MALPTGRLCRVREILPSETLRLARRSGATPGRTRTADLAQGDLARTTRTAVAATLRPVPVRRPCQASRQPSSLRPLPATAMATITAMFRAVTAKVMATGTGTETETETEMAMVAATGMAMAMPMATASTDR